jgi:hypothetical protein
VELTTRELAALIWAAPILAWALTRRGFRKSAGEIIRAALAPALLLFFTFTAAYVAGEVWLLWWSGVWTPDLIKETVLWILFVGLASAGRALTGRGRVAYSHAVVEAFQASVFVQFFVGLASFPLLVELIVIPVGCIIGLGAGLTEIGKLRASAGAFYKKALPWFGGLVLAGALLNAATYDTLWTRSGIMSFVMPPLLSLLFVPAVFAWNVYAQYEWLFGKLRGDRRFRLWARWRLFWMLGLRPTAILAFGRRYAFELPQVRDRHGFAKMLHAPTWLDRLDETSGGPANTGLDLTLR